MTIIIFAFAFAAFLVAAYLTPDKAAKVGYVGLALLTAALGLGR